jgi:hypothetical protein
MVKQRPPLPLEEALRRVVQITPLLAKDTWYALRARAVLHTANEIVCERDIDGPRRFGDTYNVVQNSLALTVALARSAPIRCVKELSCRRARQGLNSGARKFVDEGRRTRGPRRRGAAGSPVFIEGRNSARAIADARSRPYYPCTMPMQIRAIIRKPLLGSAIFARGGWLIIYSIRYQLIFPASMTSTS